MIIINGTAVPFTSTSDLDVLLANDFLKVGPLCRCWCALTYSLLARPLHSNGERRLPASSITTPLLLCARRSLPLCRQVFFSALMCRISAADSLVLVSGHFDFVCSEEATTCHIFSVRDPSTGLALLCHFDGGRIDNVFSEFPVAPGGADGVTVFSDQPVNRVLCSRAGAVGHWRVYRRTQLLG